MYDVIGRPARFGDIIFVPILGDYEFGAPYSYLEDQPCSFSIPQIVVEYDIYDHNCWWTRARLIEIFAVDHPVGGNLTRVLEFLFVAVFYSPTFLTAVPVLLSEQRKDSWSPTTAALSFKSLFTGAIADRITNAFWQLLTQDSQALGVFSDYFAVGWHDARDDYDRSNAGALYKVACDGTEFDIDFLGHLNPEFTSEELSEFTEQEWDCPPPLTLPRKRRNHAMHRSRRSRQTC